MSIFASQTTITIPIPFDVPHTVTIRKLTGREVEQAQAADALLVAKGAARTWAARFQRMVTTGDPKAMESLHDPLVGFDRTSIIKAGLLSWSYKEDPKTAITDLDDEATEFLAQQILKLTKPALFVTGEAVEDAQKERSGVVSVA